MSNQKSPLASRVSPCAVAALPAVLFTLRYFTSPVLVSTFPMLPYLLLFGVVDGVIEIAVEAHAAVMRELADLRGRSERPIGAVVVVVLGPDAGVGVEREIVERPRRAGGFAARPRALRDLD